MKDNQNKVISIESKLKNKGINLDGSLSLERCVMPDCQKVLNVPINTNISLRKYYIEGVGQLCKDCYNKIYGF